MNIQDATKKALEENKYIRRKSTKHSTTRIKPTNSYDCCLLVVHGKDRQQGRCWNPTADDLMADDWIIAKE